MKLLKWFQEKTGKMSVNLMQAAGITAVVGAAGVAAVSYLQSPADNNTFMPPSSFEQAGQVQYVSRGGAGQYAANGAVRSSIEDISTASLDVSERQRQRQQQMRALEEAGNRPVYAGEEDSSSIPMPKAYQVGGAGVDLDRNSVNLNAVSPMGEMPQLNKEIPGLQEALQAASQQEGAAGAADQSASSGAAASGQPGGQFVKASLQSGQGSVRAGSGGGVSNSFVIQNSGKNVNSKDAASAMAQAGNVLADAQAAMNSQMQEGTRMRGSRASFGRTDGLGEERNVTIQGARRRYGDSRDELKFIRKQSTLIAQNKNKSANEGGRPFLSSSQISGGITVDGGQVTTGAGSTTADLSASDRLMRGVKGWAAKAQADADEREYARDSLKSWLFQIFTQAIIAIIGIAVLVKMARAATLYSWIFWAAAGALTALILARIWFWHGAIEKVGHYHSVCGTDGWTVFGWGLASVLTLGVGFAWTKTATKAVTKAQQALDKFKEKVGLKGEGLKQEELLDKGSSDPLGDVQNSMKPENLFSHGSGGGYNSPPPTK